jgi:hypothetical protein
MSDFERVLAEIGELRFQFWVCPVEGHSGRFGDDGPPVETVRWVGDVAHCLSPGCGRTSATAEADTYAEEN